MASAWQDKIPRDQKGAHGSPRACVTFDPQVLVAGAGGFSCRLLHIPMLSSETSQSSSLRSALMFEIFVRTRPDQSGNWNIRCWRKYFGKIPHGRIIYRCVDVKLIGFECKSDYPPAWPSNPSLSWPWCSNPPCQAGVKCRFSRKQSSQPTFDDINHMS
jgi:hypothetical protein